MPIKEFIDILSMSLSILFTSSTLLIISISLNIWNKRIKKVHIKDERNDLNG